MLFTEACVDHSLYSECTSSNRLKMFYSHLVFFSSGMVSIFLKSTKSDNLPNCFTYVFNHWNVKFLFSSTWPNHSHVSKKEIYVQLFFFSVDHVAVIVQ